MEEMLCSIEISRDSHQLKAKVQSNKGRYLELQNDDLDYLLEMVYEDIQKEIEEDYWQLKPYLKKHIS